VIDAGWIHARGHRRVEQLAEPQKAKDELLNEK
jgi:hypothetical protein